MIECPYCHDDAGLCFQTYLTSRKCSLVCRLCGAWVYWCCDIMGNIKGEWHKAGEMPHKEEGIYV